MPHYSGSATTMEALRGALVAACVSNGWSWDSNGELLSKSTIYVKVTVSAATIALVARSTPTTGEMPGPVKIGPIFAKDGSPNYAVTFPAAYDIFVFDQEVFMVVNYSVDRYQWCAFGRSTIDGLPGSGTWCGATNAANPTGVIYPFAGGPIWITATGGGDWGNNGQNTAALFWAEGGAFGSANNCWVDSGLDDQGWLFGSDQTRAAEGVKLLAPLMAMLPNAWNSEAVLLPIRAHKLRASSKISLIADLTNARYTRIDNYSPGDIITIGSDRWKIFPWHRKNSAVRDGGQSIEHTGTFGWAIRYEGA